MTDMPSNLLKKRLYLLAVIIAVFTLLPWWLYMLFYSRDNLFLIAALPLLMLNLLVLLWRYARRPLSERTARAGVVTIFVFALGTLVSMLLWPFPAALQGVENLLLIVVSLIGYLLLPARTAMLASAALYAVTVVLTWTAVTAHSNAVQVWLAALIRQGGSLVVILLLYMVAHMRQGWKTESVVRQREQRLANTDALTELLNRRGLGSVIERAVVAAGSEHFCVVLTDIDAFKRVNDLFGHQTGDEVLRRFAAALQTELRDGDELGRWGGEEYLLVLPRTDLLGALHVAERLRARIEAAPLLDGHPVTASFGVSAWRADDTFEFMLRRADQALYRAKAGGKNRVVAEAEA